MALLSDVTGIGNIGLAGIPTTVLGTATTITGPIDINAGTIDGTVIGGSTAAAITATTLNATGGGSLTGTWANLGTVTTVDLNGGTIDGTVIGGTTAAAGSFTTGAFSGDVTIGSATGQNSVFGTIIGSGGANEGTVIVSSATGTGWLGFNNGNNASIPGQVTYNHATNVLSLYSSGTVSVTGAATFSGTVNGLTLAPSASGNRWGVTAEVASNGVMEVGRYIDFHSTDGDTSDYGARLDFDGTNLIIAANTVTTGAATFSGTVAGGGLSISNASGGNVAQFTNVSSADLNINLTSGVTLLTPSTGILAFGTNNTERLRIDASGNVGIGTVPSAWGGAVDAVQTSAGSVWGYLTSDLHLSQNQYWNGSSRIYSTTAAASEYRLGLGGHFWYTTPSGTAGTAVTQIERMTLDASGNFFVGATALTANANFFGTSPGNAFSDFGHVAGVGSGVAYTRFLYAGSVIGSITQNGTTGVLYTSPSDYRLKEDSVPMTGATERVKALRPINFAWKFDGSRTDGFFAHELAEVVPEAATGSKDAMRDEEYEVTPAVEEVRDEDGNVTTEAVAAVMGTRSVPDYQGIDQSKLVPLLTATIQELIARIEALEGA